MDTHTARQSFIPLFLFSFLILACYSNTFISSWHLDDTPNIIENSPLRIDNLAPETIKKTLYAGPTGNKQLYRPVACFSFALNWYFGQDNPFGYHIVNFLIHILTTVYLFKTILLILQSQRFKQYTTQDAVFISLIASTLWAINPIQTQAVTYIVQRMTSMAAMFYIFASYNYIRARHAEKPFQCANRYILSAIYFLLALGSKENAITLIPSLLLIELFFLEKDNKFSKIIFTLLLIANICIILAALYYIIDQHYLQSITEPYNNRPFSIAERLLTQPSILLFYLSLLLYPSPARLSIDHSFPVSTSLLHPWTTLPAILCIAALLFIAIWNRRKTPLLSFSILFFFINHLVESTIIPLELLFEHRNYLPSFFLFLPIAAGLRLLFKYSAASSRIVQGTLFLLIPILLIAIGIGTYSRNQVWATEESLWADSLNKAPHNTRPLAYLGVVYGWQKKRTPENFRIAVALLQKSLDQDFPNTTFKSALVDDIGKVYANYGMLDEAIKYYNKSLQLNPDFYNSRLDLADALTRQGNFAQALEQIDIVLTKDSNQLSFLFNQKTMLLLWLDRPQDAVESSGQAMKRASINKEQYFFNTGVALSRAGYHRQGKWFLKRAMHHSNKDTWILYSLIENCLLSKDTSGAKQYALQLLDRQGISSLMNKLNKLRTDYSAAPVNVDLIAPIIVEAAQETVSDAVNTLTKQPK